MFSGGAATNRPYEHALVVGPQSLRIPYVLTSDHAALALELKAALTPDEAPVLLLSGGELTVTRRGDGVGGPNAEYALAMAIALDGASGIHAIACDTDGVDGAAEVAGAFVDATTLGRARALGLSASNALACPFSRCKNTRRYSAGIPASWITSNC